MICILGTSHAPGIFREAVKHKGILQCENPAKADLVIVAQDTPTWKDGFRQVIPIRTMIEQAIAAAPRASVLVTSQVPVGFMRSLGVKRIWHMAETLRIKDSLDRALKPEQIILGGPGPLPYPLTHFVEKWGCPIVRCSWEEAEFSKIAINNMLIAQVEMAAKLKAIADNNDIDWKIVQKVLMHDKRIGPHAYLDGGDWTVSKHLMRDHRTLREMACSLREESPSS